VNDFLFFKMIKQTWLALYFTHLFLVEERIVLASDSENSGLNSSSVTSSYVT
jgi:hypothetical protein